MEDVLVKIDVRFDVKTSQKRLQKEDFETKMREKRFSFFPSPENLNDSKTNESIKPKIYER